MTANIQPVASGVPEDIQLALVIAGSQVTGSTEQRHAGFLVQYDNRTLWLFDLAWDNTYRQAKMTDEYAYLASDFFDPFTSNALVGFLVMALQENNGKISYSINYEDSPYFDKSTGKALNTKPGQGLTCATFVIETLERYGIELIDRDSWPITEENAKWQKDILQKLIFHTRPPLSIEKFLAQFQYIGKTPRFRPEEALGAASIYTGNPLAYEAVSPEATSVVLELDRLGLK